MKLEKLPTFATSLASSNLALLLAACGGSSDPPPAAGTAAATRSGSTMTRATVQSATAQAASAHHFYVSPDGADSNPGTQAAPFRTLQKAADTVGADSTVHVAPGTYSGNVRIRKSGQEAARIYFVSEQPGAARIVPPSTSSNASAINIEGSHVTVSGFDIDGSDHAGGTKWRIGILSNASDVSIENNRIHDIAAQPGDCTNSGGGGIVADSSGGGTGVTIDGNDVHDIGPTTECHFIHGIYMSTTGTVSNNLIHRTSYGGVQLWHDADQVSIVNNTIFNTPKAIIVGTGERYHLSHPGDNNNVADNILVDNEYAIVEVSDGGGHGTHNRYTGNVYFRNRVNENLYAEGKKNSSGNVVADPKFVDYRLDGSGNYQLQSGSPAAGKGVAFNVATLN